MSLVTRNMSSFFKDKEGNPLSMEDADRLLGNRFYAVVGRTRIHESYNPWISLVVSTVWLGVSITPGELFETMIFPTALAEDHLGISSVDEYQWRYANEQIAAEAHTRIVYGMRALFEDPVTENVKAPALMPVPVRLAIVAGD